jgi:hypothetical protein
VSCSVLCVALCSRWGRVEFGELPPLAQSVLELGLPQWQVELAAGAVRELAAGAVRESRRSVLCCAARVLAACGAQAGSFLQSRL